MSDLGLVLWAPEDGRVSQRSVPPHQSRLAGGQQATDGNKVSQCREGLSRSWSQISGPQKRREEGEVERRRGRGTTAFGVEGVHVRGG